MKLAVHVLGREVGILESQGDFKSVFTYLPVVSSDDFVSLTMPVRTESWKWDGPLHPIFQMHLPEGFLLQTLQEQLGPQVGAAPTTLLSFLGRRMIGRLQVSVPGADLDQPPQPFELKEVLQGDNSEVAFANLVRRYAVSGVSGAMPKFLEGTQGIGENNKSTFLVGRYLVKGSSAHLPHLALNEHLCLKVAERLIPTARTHLSDDGLALVVERFDVDGEGKPEFGLEDFCVLLGLAPTRKYETTWERIHGAVSDHVSPEFLHETRVQLGYQLLLTYALRNADCHAKNLSLIYHNRRDVHLAPAYDLITTVAYAGYQDNPPGISLAGKKTWQPGKTVQTFLKGHLGLSFEYQKEMVERVCQAVSDTQSEIPAAMERYPSFRELGKWMLNAWSDGIDSLRDKRVYALAPWPKNEAVADLSDPTPRLAPATRIIGRSEAIAPPRVS